MVQRCAVLSRIENEVTTECLKRLDHSSGGVVQPEPNIPALYSYIIYNLKFVHLWRYIVYAAPSVWHGFCSSYCPKSRWNRSLKIQVPCDISLQSLDSYSGWWFRTCFIFHFIYGMSSFPLTNSYFSRWLLHHQPVFISHISPYWGTVAHAAIKPLRVCRPEIMENRVPWSPSGRGSIHKHGELVDFGCLFFWVIFEMIWHRCNHQVWCVSPACQLL